MLRLTKMDLSWYNRSMINYDPYHPFNYGGPTAGLGSSVEQGEGKGPCASGPKVVGEAAVGAVSTRGGVGSDKETLPKELELTPEAQLGGMILNYENESRKYGYGSPELSILYADLLARVAEWMLKYPKKITYGRQDWVVANLLKTVDISVPQKGPVPESVNNKIHKVFNSKEGIERFEEAARRLIERSVERAKPTGPNEEVLNAREKAIQGIGDTLRSAVHDAASGRESPIAGFLNRYPYLKD